MRRIYIILAALALILSFCAGYMAGRPAKIADNSVKLDSLQKSYVLIDQINRASVIRLNVLSDTLKKRDAQIAAIEARLDTYDLKLKSTSQYYEKRLFDLAHAPLHRLDSFRWAKFPDSLSVARFARMARTRDSLRSQ